MRMHHILGQQLKKNYPHIFRDGMMPQEMDLYCSESDRTIMSAQSQLLGLFPLGKGYNITVSSTDPKQKRYFLPPNPLTIPIPKEISPIAALPYNHPLLGLKVLPKALDELIIPSITDLCPKLEIIRKKFFDGIEKKHIDTISRPLTKSLAEIGITPEKTGVKGRDYFNLSDLWTMFDEIEVHLNLENKLPDKISPDLYARLKAAGSYAYYQWNGPKKVHKFFTSKMAAEIISGLETAISETKGDKSDQLPSKKFQLFSAHDTNIALFLSNLGLVDPECYLEQYFKKETKLPCRPMPPFAANLLFELKKRGDVYFIRTLYNGSPLPLCSNTPAPTLCPFSTFKSLFSSHLILTEQESSSPSLQCGNQVIDNKDHIYPYQKRRGPLSRSVRLSLYCLYGCTLGGIFLLSIIAFILGRKIRALNSRA